MNKKYKMIQKCHVITHNFKGQESDVENRYKGGMERKGVSNLNPNKIMKPIRKGFWMHLYAFYPKNETTFACGYSQQTSIYPGT